MTHRSFPARAACRALLLATAAMLAAPAAMAAGSHSGGHGRAASIGQPGKGSPADRIVEMTAYDNYFEPETLSVKKGETVRFVVTNRGGLVHEFNLGTAAMHEAHQAEMAMMVEHGVLEPDRINHHMMKMDMGNGHTMDHDDPNSVLIEPGQTAEIVWTFTTDAELEFACNMPGHYGAGMVGRIDIEG